jgi:O-antigen ligase
VIDSAEPTSRPTYVNFDLARSSALAAERFALAVTALAVGFLPLVIPAGPANVAPIDGFIALAIGACVLWAGTVGWRWRFPYAVPCGLLLAGGALGALIGPVPRAGLVALVQDIVLLLWCWAVANIGHSARNLRILLATWAYSGIGWAVLAFVGLATGSRVLSGQIDRQGSRVQATLADPSYAANYFLITMMIIWATRRPRRRLVRLATYGLLLAAIASTGSNSGMVGVVVAFVVAGLLGAYRRFGGRVAVVLLALVALAGLVAVSKVSVGNLQNAAHESRFVVLREGLGRSTDSADQRQMILHESARLWREGSPLGEGPVSTEPRIDRQMGSLVKEAHDDYFAALLERGAIGFVGVLLLVAALILRGFSVATVKLRRSVAEVLVRPNALVGAVAATLVAGTVYELLHVRHVWALFAFIAASYTWGRGNDGT